MGDSFSLVDHDTGSLRQPSKSPSHHLAGARAAGAGGAAEAVQVRVHGAAGPVGGAGNVKDGAGGRCGRQVQLLVEVTVKQRA
jgi:hypothetical protein